jgi:hypothetical protein
MVAETPVRSSGAIDGKGINLQKTAKKVKNLKQTPDF